MHSSEEDNLDTAGSRPLLDNRTLISMALIFVMAIGAFVYLIR